MQVVLLLVATFVPVLVRVNREAEAEHFSLNLCMKQSSVLSGESLQLGTVMAVSCHQSQC